ncbi:atherin [Triticum urartu]|uniref:Uncharacterized protein n=1 Tax=Triticum urartu TaxID=4572 RepID=A0A8R7U5W6_TRIUA|nr:atherin [Triticum urartu]
MARRSVHRRQEFSFAGDSPTPSPSRGALPPRPPVAATANPMAPRAGEEDFRWLQASGQGSPESGSGSGTPSPQLWAHREQDHHHDRLYPASAGSSPSRAQAIAGYRREMLDLVRGLPEAAYELSLRDIVESRPSPLPPPPPPPPPPPTQPYAVAMQERGGGEPKKDVPAAAIDNDEAKKPSDSGGKKQGKVRKQRTMGRTRSRSMERSVSLDTGLLIKLFLPLSGGRKKKVSPKPAAVAPAKDGRKKTKTKKKKKQGKKEEEEEWWKKSEFSQAGSSSGSSNSSASRNSGIGIGNGNGGSDPKAPTRSRSRKRIGCYGFFGANKGKNGVIQE